MAALACCSNENLQLWALSGSSLSLQLQTSPLQQSQLQCLAYNHNSQVVAVGASEAPENKRGIAALVFVKDGIPMETLKPAFLGPVHTVCFSSKSRQLVLGGSQGGLRVWDLKNKVGASLSSCSVTPETMLSDYAFVTMCGIPREQVQMQALAGHAGTVTSAQWGAKDESIASCSAGAVCMHSVRTGALTQQLARDGRTAGGVSSLAFDSTFLSLAGIDVEGAVSVWDARSGQCTAHRSLHQVRCLV